MNLRKSFFRFDDPSPVFAGWTRDARWNGWACPLFDHATMERLAADLGPDALWPITFDAATGDWVQSDRDYPEEAHALPRVTIEGREYFDLTGAGYCFDECTAEGEIH